MLAVNAILVTVHYANLLLQKIKNKNKKLKLLHLNELHLALQSDSDLQSIPPHKQKEILQVLYVLTGSDFTSFFAGIGKVTLYNAFYHYSSFISFPDQHTPGSISDVSPDSNGFLSFVKLIGVANFTKHHPVFHLDTTIDYFKSYFTPSCLYSRRSS